MSTARQHSRGLRGLAAAVGWMALVLATAWPAAALPADPPLVCPSGQVVATVTAPPPSAKPGKPQRPIPGATTLPNGSTVQPVCVPPPPAPIPSPVVAPQHTVGGPALAASGVVVRAPASVPAPPDVTDVSYVVADLESGEVLAAKNAHAWLLPASTLKTLTSLVVLPAVPPATKVVATDSEVAADGTRVGMVAGATYTVDDLFHGLIMVSGNDTAYALADVFGGRDKTVAAMNAKAGALGAWDTIAVDPSGLDAQGQHSSAYDLALLGRAVMQLPAYRAYATTEKYTFPGGTDRSGKVLPPFEIQNHNTLLENYPGTFGVKNGYTTGARHTFIGAVTRGGRTLLVTEMGGVVVPSWQPTAGLLDWAFAYASQLAPVGRLVSAGAPRPPELGGVVVPTTAGTPLPAAGTDETDPGPTPTPAGTGSTTGPAAKLGTAGTVVAAQALPGGRPALTWWGVAGGVAVLALLVGASLRLARARRPGG